MSRSSLPTHVQAAIERGEKMEARDPWVMLSGKPPLAVRDLIEPPTAKGRIAKPRGMNKLEADYQGHLFARRSVGEVLWYKYEPVKLRLADNTFYCPDFMLLLKSGELQIHEVKGHWEDDARVKIKVAASIYPFKFIAVQRKNGGWAFEEF